MALSNQPPETISFAQLSPPERPNPLINEYPPSNPSTYMPPESMPEASTSKSPPRKPPSKRTSNRQTVSCAECKRLKLKCNSHSNAQLTQTDCRIRQWPCTSCVRRGCAQLCPSLSMVGGKGRRLILANTQELHERIAELEKALAIAHAKTSPTPHELLTTAFLYAPKEPRKHEEEIPAAEESDEEKQEYEESEGEIALGTLTIGADGEAQYVGNAAGSSFLMDAADNERTFSGGPSASVSSLDIQPSHVLAHFPMSSGLSLVDLWRMLPAWEQDPEKTIQDGRRMVDCYLENVTWMYDPVPRPILDNDYLPSVYGKHVPNAHKLACVYLIMALGVMFDLEHREYRDPLADELCRLGSLCLGFDASALRPTIASVQALCLLSLFLLNRFPENGQGASHVWSLMGLGVNSITALGLHREFNLSPFEQEERRKTIWEFLTVERLQSMCFARPPLLLNRFIETPFPGHNVTNPEEKFEDPSGYFGARYTLIRLIEKVILEQNRITRGSYKSVLDIDEEITATRKDWPADLVPHIKSTSLPLPPDIHPHLMMQRFSIRMIFREAKIYLHRTYFAKALQQSPADPSSPSCKFHPSFLSVFESCIELLATVRQANIYFMSLTSRWAFFHFHAYSAAVCLAAVCIQAPTSAFASPSYMSLVLACDMAEAATEGSHASQGLRVLQRLRRRASKAIVSSTSHDPRVNRTESTSASSGTPADDDLSHLANRPSIKRVQGESPLSSASELPTRAVGSASQSPPQSLSRHLSYVPGAPVLSDNIVVNSNSAAPPPMPFPAGPEVGGPLLFDGRASLDGLDGYGIQPLLQAPSRQVPSSWLGNGNDTSSSTAHLPPATQTIAPSPQFFLDDMPHDSEGDMRGLLEPTPGGFEDVERFLESLRHS